VLMSEIEIITDGGRRRRWSAAEKLRIVEETLDERESISVVARRNGVAPNMRFVPVKSEEKQGAAAVFRMRELLIRQRTQTINACRAGGTPSA